jgi:flagellar motility protein MotE (MotC chaperone)
MTYDRRGRPAPKLDETAEVPPRARAAAPARTAAAAPAAAAAATPNAARLAQGRRAAAKPDGRGDGGKAARRRSVTPRLLPLTALVAALVLTIKVGAVWERRAEVPSLLSFDMDVSVGAPAEAGGGAVPADRQIAQAQSGTTADSADGKVDPFALGKSQIELLQSLAERRKELDARERAIEQREGLLAAAEHRIESKIDELKTIKAEIEGLIKKYDEQEEQQIAGLVKIYETMKPKDAARIFNELDMDVLLEVFERMKASKTAPVLADMDPIRAKEITTRIAERKKMPDIN